MAIPWLIGLGVAAVAAAVLSDDDKGTQLALDCLWLGECRHR